MNQRPRIVFMGTPDFAVGVLKELIHQGHHVVGVITAPDKPAGRGRKLRASAVKEYAESQGLPLLQPVKLKDEEFLASLDQWQADLQIVVAFRMLPEVVWRRPPLGTFNLHASLLPQYRGAAPINWAIINGEEITGVTTFFIDQQIDTGAIIDSTEVNIGPDETAGSLHDKLMAVGAQLVVRTVDQIATGEVEARKQPESNDIQKAPKLNPENTRIDWQADPKQIDALIRGLNPYPVAWSLLHQDESSTKVKVYSGRFELRDHQLKPGSVITEKKALGVAIKDGIYWLLELQLAGKRRMEASALLNGFTPMEGAFLE